MRLAALALYTGLVSLSNGALAQGAAPDIADLRQGDMLKLAVHSEAAAAALDEAFELEEGGTATLGDYAGKVVLVNFWATWCAPCREEMPTLSAVQSELGGEAFEVLTIATGRNSPQGMVEFFDEIGVDNLPLHTDPRQQLARSMGVLGLPVTVILDREGNELARLQGEADWSSDSAMEILGTLIASE
ncbi:TlpA disulfide reductase family protein [Wenxinia saemankumensis]|uniref:Thiol-disulfide isomerase or thioredoxin n=1 Tax=Wenxinia saemankumensis TaxID=1447782 RepID=A0A1M6C3I5_9RHOB|nr:TlpA disulfide reductase family protein [Wenxinia saemankumensis]SHI55577.1 Thiol-disulfide isomerase or thioredoxin [Wenxinia saemankumensis]